MKELDAIEKALNGSIKLISNKVISNVMPNEQHKNYEALEAVRKLRTDYILVNRSDVDSALASAKTIGLSTIETKALVGTLTIEAAALAERERPAEADLICIGYQYLKHAQKEWSLPFKTELEALVCAGQSGNEPLETRPIFAYSIGKK